MSSLVVPIEIRAFRTAKTRNDVASALADFSGLPWTQKMADGHGVDQNPQTAYTSRNVLRAPFSPNADVLERGVHLHWQLPRSLAVGHQLRAKGSPDSLVFPTVPNRWLVRRYGKGVSTRYWVVESDFLWPAGTPAATGQVSYPTQKRLTGGAMDGLVDPTSQPYSYLGRAWQPHHEKWLKSAPDRPKLTSIGYGEPAFAAYYPSCRNIFGLHDDCSDIPEVLGKKPPVHLRYEVLGGYSDKESDPVVQAQLGKWLTQTTKGKNAFDPKDQDASKVIAEIFGWSMPKAASNIKSVMCFGQLRFVPEPKNAGDDTISIAFGNTGTEALSAHLAREIVLNQSSTDFSDDGHALALIQTEHQLEALMLLDATRGHRIDLGAKFKEARHTKGFHPEPGGVVWTLRAKTEKPILGAATDHQQTENLGKVAKAHGLGSETPKSTKDAAEKTPAHGVALSNLPLAIARELHVLNTNQSSYDRLGDEIDALRSLVHFQWQKYIDCCYDVSALGQAFPDIDMVKAHVEGLLVVLDAKVARWGDLSADQVEVSQDNTRAAQALLRYIDTPDLVGIIPASLIDPDLRDWCHQAVTKPLQSRSLALDLAQQAGRLKSILLHLEQVTEKARKLGLLLKADGTKKPKLTAAAHALCDAIAACIHTPDLSAQLGGGAAGAFADAETVIAALAQEANKAAAGVEQAVSRLGSIADVELASQAAPRFWQANDPVLNISGHAPANGKVADHHRQGNDAARSGEVNCQAMQSFKLPSFRSGKSVEKMWRDKATLFEKWTSKGWGVTVSGPSLTPHLFFEWDMQVDPREGNLLASRRRLDKKFVERNYQLDETQVDLASFNDTASRLVTARSTLTGRSILSSHAPVILAEQIDRYLASAMRTYLTDSGDALAGGVAEEFLSKHARADADAAQRAIWLGKFLADDTQTERFLHWSQIQLDAAVAKIAPDQNGGKSPLRVAVLVRKTLTSVKTQSQSQGLTGFNAFLMMQEEVLQFDPIDPLGFQSYRHFTERLVQAATKNHGHTAVLPFADFHPIRSGLGTLQRLQLIDSFGLLTKISPDTLATSTHKSGTERKTQIELPPRIAQPARINFRWVSAGLDTVESNTHPATTPVCGWLTCNNLDLSIMVYDADGVMLGSIDQTGRWRAVRDHTGLGLVAEFTNEHLKNTVEWILAQAKQETGFLERYIDVLEASLEQIDPEDFEHHQAMALFMSRPLALVRASVSLEVKGLPAYNHSWESLHQTLEGHDLDDDGYRDVKFPIRIGEHHQLNDGIAGFWVDDADASGAHRFLSPQLDMGAQLSKKTGDEQTRNPLNFSLTIAQEPRLVSILMDPRGSAHCTSGILPTKELRLPSEHYLPALRAIRPQFLTSPILTPTGKTELPLATVPDWGWEWVQADGQDWETHGTEPVLDLFDLLEDRGGQGDQDWQDMLDAGWLHAIPGQTTRALVVPIDRRGDLPKAQAEVYKRLLTALPKMLCPAPTTARFGPTSELREGWLQMKPKPTSDQTAIISKDIP